MPTTQFGAQSVEITSDNLSIARTVSDPSVGWRLESGVVSESDPVFEHVSLVPRSLACYCKVSRELFEDSANIGRALEAAFVGAASAEVERVALAGTGTPPIPRGIRFTTGVNKVSQGTNGLALSSWDAVLDLIGAVWASNEPIISGMIMSPRSLTTIGKFKEAVSLAPLAVPETVRGIPKAATTAVSITETQGGASNSSTLYLGNWSRLIYGWRNQAPRRSAAGIIRPKFTVRLYDSPTHGRGA